MCWCSSGLARVIVVLKETPGLSLFPSQSAWRKRRPYQHVQGVRAKVQQQERGSSSTGAEVRVLVQRCPVLPRLFRDVTGRLFETELAHTLTNLILPLSFSPFSRLLRQRCPGPPPFQINTFLSICMHSFYLLGSVFLLLCSLSPSKRPLPLLPLQSCKLHRGPDNWISADGSNGGIK